MNSVAHSAQLATAVEAELLVRQQQEADEKCLRVCEKIPRSLRSERESATKSRCDIFRKGICSQTLRPPRTAACASGGRRSPASSASGCRRGSHRCRRASRDRFSPDLELDPHRQRRATAHCGAGVSRRRVLPAHLVHARRTHGRLRWSDRKLKKASTGKTRLWGRSAECEKSFSLPPVTISRSSANGSANNNSGKDALW